MPDRLTTASLSPRPVFMAVAGLVLAGMLWWAQGSGINADERWQHAYERALLDFYGTLGSDTTALQMPDQLHLYGGAFELTNGLLTRAVGQASPASPAYRQIRHALIAGFGFLSVLFAALSARALAGWPAALLTVIFLVLSPRFLGHALMNPKDIPFAAGYMISVYYLMQLLTAREGLNWRNAAGLAIGIGLAIGTRVGGLILLGYVALFSAIGFWWKLKARQWASAAGFFFNYFKYYLVAVTAGYLLALLCWPYALAAPLRHPLEALREMSDFSTSIQLLFEGRSMASDEIPWYYALKWPAITLPLFSLTGILLFVIFLRGILRQGGGPAPALIASAALFPLAYVIFSGAPLYDGWRHLLFIYPPLVVLVSLGWLQLFRSYLPNGLRRSAGLLIVMLFVAEPAAFLFRYTAYPYVYFNPLIGGSAGALGRYELDYWGLSVRPAVAWLEKEDLLHHRDDRPLVLATNFPYPLQQYLGDRYQHQIEVKYLSYRNRYASRWDYGLFVARFIDGGYLRAGSWPGSKAIHAIEADGVSLLAMLQDSTGYTTQGLEALRREQWPEAERYFQKEIEQFPGNEVARRGLAEVYRRLQRWEALKASVTALLRLNPEDPEALADLSLYHLGKGQTGKALAVLEQSLEVFPGAPRTLHLLATIHLDQGAPRKSLEYAQKLLTVDPTFPGIQPLIGRIYEQLDGQVDPAF